VNIWTKTRILGVLVTSLVLSHSIAWAEATSPRAMYLDYLKKLAGAKTVQEIMPYLSKNIIEKINATPADQRPMLFEVMKNFRPTGVQVQSESVDGDKAVLKLTAVSPLPLKDASGMKDTTTGKVDFVREGKEWKIEHEAYESNMASDTGAPSGTPPESSGSKASDSKLSDSKASTSKASDANASDSKPSK